MHLRPWNKGYFYAPDGTGGGTSAGGNPSNPGTGGGNPGTSPGNGPATGGGSNSPPSPAPGAGSGVPWYQGKPIAPEVIGHWKNRGWSERSAEEIAVAATQAHQEAEKYIGVPASQIVRLPTDASDEAGWKNVYARLGVPTEAKDYALDVKFADGTELDPSFVEFMRASAASNHLTKDAAAGVTKSFVKFLEDREAADAAEHTAALETEKAELKKNWGTNFDGHMFIAKRAAAALGVTPEAVQALEDTVGYAKVMEMFRQIGSKIGEDKFISSNTSGTGMLTKDMALARVGELKADKQWVTKYLAGDAQAKREMQSLMTIIAGT